MKAQFLLLTAAFVAAKAQDATLFDVVTSTDDLSTLATAIDLAGLEEYLTTTSSLTFFTPNNAALESLPAKYLTPGFALHLRSILEIHMIEGAMASSNITDFAAFEAVSGDTIIATVNDQGIFFSGDVFSGAQVVSPGNDIMASNGNIVTVNQYFLPLALAYDLYDLATSLPNFDQIRTLITEAGLEDELRQDNRTILSPSDQAFDLLSDDLVAQVSSNPGFRDDLLLYHIIIGCYPSSLITDGLEVMTALGVTMNFTVVDKGNSKQYIVNGPINSAAMLSGDLISSNGVAHALVGLLEVPVRNTPFMNQTSTSPVAAPTGNTEGSVPSAGPAGVDSPVQLASDAPMTAPPVAEDPPVQSSAPVLCVSLMVVLSSALGFL